MPHDKKTDNDIDNDTIDNNGLNTEVDLLAERYLDLWQDNLRHWATDPKALEKWLSTK